MVRARARSLLCSKIHLLQTQRGNMTLSLTARPRGPCNSVLLRVCVLGQLGRAGMWKLKSTLLLTRAISHLRLVGRLRPCTLHAVTYASGKRRVRERERGRHFFALVNVQVHFWSTAESYHVVPAFMYKVSTRGSQPLGLWHEWPFLLPPRSHDPRRSMHWGAAS